MVIADENDIAGGEGVKRDERGGATLLKEKCQGEEL